MQAFGCNGLVFKYDSYKMRTGLNTLGATAMHAIGPLPHVLAQKASTSCGSATGAARARANRDVMTMKNFMMYG